MDAEIAAILGGGAPPPPSLLPAVPHALEADGRPVAEDEEGERLWNSIESFLSRPPPR